jgi:hypothetical protein
MSLRSLTSFGVAIAALVIVTGCSESGPKTIPVYGTVTFVGRDPPKTCQIYFTPIKTEGLIRPTVAERQSNGSYAAKSFSTSRGILPGTYRVLVTYYELKPGKDPNRESNWDELKFDDGELVVDANSSGIKHDIEVAPKKS